MRKSLVPGPSFGHLHRIHVGSPTARADLSIHSMRQIISLYRNHDEVINARIFNFS